MRELIRTNDAVLLNYIEALLRDQQIIYMVADTNMSIMDGSIGILPRRILVEDDSHSQALRLLREAGLEKEFTQHGDRAG